jgi:hypothetical protein
VLGVVVASEGQLACEGGMKVHERSFARVAEIRERFRLI